MSTTVISETTQRKQTSLYKLNKIMAGKHTSDSGSGWIQYNTGLFKQGRTNFPLTTNYVVYNSRLDT